ncbi:MAG TPA: outer membrane beta-barrel protein [Gemmatimonadaceae bacterium]|nr:outer membrane beta-barrel protein [Gemmatimonadaceae bacterium]
MRRSTLLTTVVAALLGANALAAQRPVSIGIAGGASIPAGDLRDGVEVGWHGLATIAVSTLMQPLGLRIDVAYNRFAFSDGATALADEYQSTSSATLNFTYRLPMTNSPMSPYLISGLGAYRSECSLDSGCEATTRYGWNVGLGTKLFVLGFRSFLEARYHRTEIGDTDVQYFTPTFGILF